MASLESLFAASNWPFLAVVLLFALLLFADGWATRFGTRELPEEDDTTPLEEQYRDLQYLHSRVREEEFRRAMFEQHQALLDRPEETHQGDQLGISVESLMTRRVLSVLPDTPREEVVGAMESIGSRHLIVCDERDRLLGVISDRDITARKGMTAGEIMTCSAFSVNPQTSTAHAIALMLRHHISCLPVVDAREQLVGVLTTSDLLVALSCYLELSVMLSAPMTGLEGARRRQRHARSLRQNAPLGKADAMEALAGVGGRSPEVQAAATA
jgi:CBS domain-containing protein